METNNQLHLHKKIFQKIILREKILQDKILQEEILELNMHQKKFLQEKILQVKKVSKDYTGYKDNILTAVSDVSFDVFKGECVAIVGESGCGKSTLARLISRIESPNSGEIIYQNKNITSLKGKELRELHRHIQVVFQNPFHSFSPKMRIREFLCEPFINYEKMSKKDALIHAIKLLEKVELNKDCLNKYAHELSGGQLQRIAIARAIALSPSLIICDEVTSALDVSLQKQIMELFIKLQKEEHITILFICHDLAVVQNYCDRILVMYRGSILEKLKSQNISNMALHPYTKALIQSVFTVESSRNLRVDKDVLDVSLPFIKTSGCLYSDRCKNQKARCLTVNPELHIMDKDHQVRCHTYLSNDFT